MAGRAVFDSHAQVTVERSDTADFDLRIAKMEDIVPPCTKQLLEVTQCVNEARSNPSETRPAQEACAAVLAAQRDCYQQREGGLRAIDEKCAGAKEEYEGCMRSAPQAASCIELLDRFLGCAEAATQT